jgi:hypothetical protein
MPIFIFNNFLNRYGKSNLVLHIGFRTVAEKKYLQFLVSVHNFNTIFRVNVFARISNIL